MMACLTRVEKAVWFLLLLGLAAGYPGLLIYNVVTGYLAVYVANLGVLQNVPGVQSLLLIDALAAVILGSLSGTSAWFLLKRHRKAVAVIFSFLSIAMVFYLLEPLWFRIAGFPLEYLQGHWYENPFALLRPVWAGLVFGLYFGLSRYVKVSTGDG